MSNRNAVLARISRRGFLARSAVGTAIAGAGFWSSRAAAEPNSPNERLGIGVIGVANRGASNLDGVRHERIVALCDIDDRYLDETGKAFSDARRYNDFRKLLEQKDLDAVVVSTADHTHAVASVSAMQLGKHVYCEKPLTHTVHEARIVAETAKKMRVATQMGTQIHEGDNYRRVVELVQAGAIGPVGEVYVWVNSNWSGGDRPQDAPPTPPGIHWDLWLGPAPARPYHPTYIPANWRRWWDFGGGTLADMGCHYMDLPFWALALRSPTSIAVEGPPVHPETAPEWLAVRYEFPARDTQPPVVINWLGGTRKPEALKRLNVSAGDAGVLFVGSAGMLLADYSNHALLPEDKFRDYAPPEPSIPHSIGHYREWLAACRGGATTTCNFDYGGALTETILLGNVAYRSGETLAWDAKDLRVTNSAKAQELITREYRDGWVVKG